MTNRQPLVLGERLPLLKADLHANAVELAPHRHRHARQTMMHFVFEVKSPNHSPTSPVLISHSEPRQLPSSPHSSIVPQAPPLDLNASMNDARFQGRRLSAKTRRGGRGTLDRPGSQFYGGSMALDHPWDRAPCVPCC